jgi:fermentation-respiration switch protein FrsA (DUF1100 family)
MLLGLIVGAGLYLAILLWFRVNEDHLLFFPDTGPLPPPPSLLGDQAKTLHFRSPDGPRLAAWVVPPPGLDSAALWVLILHGNAGDIASPGRPEHDRQLHDLGLGVLAMDYRGYGESEGVPSESGLYADAHAAYDVLRDTVGIPAKRIVIYGHSLGAAVAVQLATTVEAAGLILEGAFTSVPDRGKELYPWLPVHWMVRNRFNSLGLIGQIRMPLLIIHGRDDATIPIAHGRRLFAAAPEPKTFLDVPGGHDDAFQTGAVQYQTGIRRFAASLAAQ